MRRQTEHLKETEYDLLVVGGGIYGATAAWDAAQRGLRVALIDKNDFASGTSFNSLKIIHGGLRYLQHADIVRMRESIRERRILSRIAPHLVQPLPCVMPTKGHTLKGPEVMRIALLINDVMSMDRNRGVDPAKQLPGGRVISKKSLLDILPYLDPTDLNGGAIWYDAQMVNSERLLLSFIHSAVQEGADAANYVQAVKPVMSDGRVRGMQVRDTLNDKEFEISAKMTLNAAGPWVNQIISSLNLNGHWKPVGFSTALNLVIDKPLGKDMAFGFYSKNEFKDSDALISKGSRLLFAVPWRGMTLIGTDHQPFEKDPDEYRITEQDVLRFLNEINQAMPKANIQREQVVHAYGGLLPMAGVNEQTGDVRLEKHFDLIDHEERHNIPGMVSIVSVKYTTARGVSEKAVSLAARYLNHETQSRSSSQPVWGGELPDYHEYFMQQVQLFNKLDENILRHLIDLYGTHYKDVLQYCANDPDLASPFPGTTTIKAQIVYAVQNEMAQTLADVIMRRTELGARGCPSRECLEECAGLMADKLNWSVERRYKEIDSVEQIYVTF